MDGPDYSNLARHLIAQIESLGYAVEVKKVDGRTGVAAVKAAERHVALCTDGTEAYHAYRAVVELAASVGIELDDG